MRKPPARTRKNRARRRLEALEARQLLAVAVNDTAVATQAGGPVGIDVLANDMEAAAEIVLYSDDFDGTGPLSATIPDVSGGEPWIASGLWNADGTKPNNGTASSFLPFAPTPGRVFTLSIDANPDISGSSDWFAAGFSEGTITNQWHNGANNTVGWLLNREDDASSTVIQTFLGPGTATSGNHDLNPDVVGPITLEIVLDTTAPAWTIEWIADGTSIRGPVAFGTNPTINYVGFGAWNTATGSVDNFSLTVQNPGGDNLEVTRASSATGAPVNVPGGLGASIDYDPGNIASGSDTITYAITDSAGVNRTVITAQGSAGAFNVSGTDLLEGITPAVSGSALGGQEGTSNNPAVLSNGTFGAAGLPDAAALAETVSVANDTVLTYDLDLTTNPQGYDLTSVNIYSGWRDAGRDNQNYVVSYSTVEDPDVFIPAATVGYVPNPSPSGLVNVSAAGGVFAGGVARVQIAFGAQENGYVGYREIDAFGVPSATATVDVTVNNVDSAPVAVADTASAFESGGAISVDVTGNDTDADGDDFRVVGFDAASASGATVSAGPGGTLVYDPNTTAAFDGLAVGESATDTFTYTVTDVTEHLTGAFGSVGANGTVNVLTGLDNAALGNDRRVQIEFDVVRSENSGGDSWFTLELLGTGAGVFGADSSSLVRTRTDGAAVHQQFTNGANVANSTVADITVPIERRVVATVDLGPAGIAPGAEAFVTFEIDDMRDGVVDHVLSAPFTLTDTTLDIAVQTTGKAHEYGNFNVISRRGGLIPNLFNTGVDDNGAALPGDVDDPHYDLTAQPVGGITDATVNADGFPIPPWAANEPDSAWIGPNAADGSGPEGDYTYRTTFSVPADADLGSVRITGRWATDNMGNDILINGMSTGNTVTGFAAYVDFEINSGFQVGLNTLDFVMFNGPGAGPTGLRVDNVRGIYQELATSTATVTVTVAGTNDGPPVAVDDPSGTVNVSEDAAATDITAAILANDTDPDNDGAGTEDTLTVQSIDATGTTGSVTLSAGTVSYDPNGQFESLSVGDTATETFTYTISDRDPLQTGLPITDLFNTGVDAGGTPLAGDVDDPHYEIIAQPAGGLVDATIPADGFPIGAWLGNDANSAWTGPDNADAANDGNGPPGTYIYRTTFTIPADADLNSVSISGNWATDNSGSDILINGVPTGNTAAGFNAYSAFSITSGFTFGVNNLDFLVVNGAPTGPTGLRVDDMTGTYDIGYLSTSGTATVTVTGVNDAPTVATPTATVTVDEGQTATNSGTFSDIDDNDTVTITATMGGMPFGTISQDTGNAGNWTWSYPTTDGPSESGTVTITADDGRGEPNSVVTTTFDLVVNNLPPTATITGQTEAALDALVPFTFTATDPSAADQAGNFTFEVDWGDGTPVETFTGMSPLVRSHAFQSIGPVTVSVVTVTDKDGGVSDPPPPAATHTIDIVPVAIVGDDLVATGTDGSDTIIFYSNGLGIRVRYNNIYYPLDGSGYSFSGQIIANGRGGSDRLIVSHGLLVDANFSGGDGNDYLAGGVGNDTMDGGAGNDVVLGGEGDNVLDGGDDNDRLEGRSGADIIFGGAGNDRIVAGAGDDILDGGSDNDMLHGGLGNDLIFGDIGSDTIDGYYGNDVIFGGADADQLFGRSDHDLLIGGLGGDRVRGNDGDDALIGGMSALEAQLEADLDLLQSNGGMGGLSAAVQTAVDAWFASPGEPSRLLFDPLTPDTVQNDLTGDTGADTFVQGGNDYIRDFRLGEDTVV